MDKDVQIIDVEAFAEKKHKSQMYWYALIRWGKSLNWPIFLEVSFADLVNVLGF